MDRIENILSKYRSKIIAPLVLVLSALVLTQFYFVFEITPQPNDECLWVPQEVSKDSIGYFFADVKIDGVTWNAGIRDGDQLLKINNKPITKLSEATSSLISMAEGDSALYTVSREDEVFETKVEVKKLIQFGGFAFALLGFIWLLVGFVVIKSKESGETQITFFRIGIALVLTASFNLLVYNNVANPLFKTEILIQIIDHLWTMGSIFLPFLILKFFWIFPNQLKFFKKDWLQKSIYSVPAIIFSLLVVVKYMYVYPGKINFYKFYGVLATSSMGFVFIACIIGLISLFVNYLKIENRKDRKPIFLILIAYTLGVLAVVYTIALTLSGSVALMFNQPEFFTPIILIALLPLAFGYSIFKYSLLDVSDVVKTTLLYGIATVSIAATYFLVIYLLGQSVSYAIGTEYQWLISGVIFVAFAIIFQSTKDKFQNLITRKFYPEQFAYQQVLLKFSSDIVTIVGLENILRSTTNTFIESLKLSVFGIVLKDSSNNKFKLKDGVGLNNSSFVLNTNEKQLMGFLQEKKDAKQELVIENLDFDSVCPDSAGTLNAQGIYTILPLIIKNKIIGLLLFGLKYSGSRFAGKDIELLTAAANQTAVAIENARLYESEKEKLILDIDLENARKIQKSLLPTAIPKINRLDISGVMLPAMQVGGDYFDVIKVSDSKAFVVVGDVSGKGLAASFYMSKLQTMIKLYCSNDNTPFDVLTKINSNIYSEIEKNWFITCTIALFDIDNMNVKICRAGHTPFSKVDVLKAENVIPKGIGVGLDSGKIFNSNLEQLEIPLVENELFAFYSDGVNEAMNSNKEVFGLEKLNSILFSELKFSTSVIEKKIVSSLNEHRGIAPQNDDITFVLVKVV